MNLFQRKSNMKKPAIRHIISIGLLLLMGFSSRSQNCLENLEEAQRAYYDGEFNRTIQLLENCADKGLNSSKEIQARELLIKSALLLNEDETADQYVQKLLVKYPDYEIGYLDLVEYKSLIENYSVSPKFSYGISAGINFQNYSIMQYWSYGSETNEPENYNSKLGFSGGITGKYYFRPKLALDFSLLYQTAKYTQSEIIQQYQKISVEESMGFLSLPVQIQYQFDLNNWKLGVGAGVVSHLRVSSRMDLNIAPEQGEIIVPFLGVPRSKTYYDISEQRKTLTYGFLGSAELIRNFGRNSLSFMIGYEYGINNQVDNDDRFSDEYTQETFSYIPDDFKFDLVRFTLGYSITIFKVDRK